MSATISPEIFANYFSMTEINKVNQITKIEKSQSIKIEKYNSLYENDDRYLKNEKKETKLTHDEVKLLEY